MYGAKRRAMARNRTTPGAGESSARSPRSEREESQTPEGQAPDTALQGQGDNQGGQANNSDDRLDENSESDADEDELAQLRAVALKRQRKAERDRLRREIAGEEPATAETPGGANSLPLQQKRPLSTGEAPEGFPTAKHLRPAAPETYNGKGGAQALNRFLTALELYFDALGVPEKEHGVRVRNAGSFLRDSAAEAYLREKEKITTFEKFKEFLKGIIHDPTSRLSAAMLKLHGIEQEDEQTARQLLHTIEAVEQDIPKEMELPELRKAWHFLCALNPRLRNAVLGDIKEVKTRDQVLTAAQWQEDLYLQRQAARDAPASSKRLRGGQQGGSRPQSSYRGKGSSLQPQQVSKETKKKEVTFKERTAEHKERQKTGACYRCGSMEHKAAWHDSQPSAGGAHGQSKSSGSSSKN